MAWSKHCCAGRQPAAYTPQAPIWCIIIGAASLVIGLATYGYKCTRAMAVRVSKLSPTRGFAAELSTAMVIMIAAQYSLPTSSSQCITGGIIGVGLLEGMKGVNWSFFGKMVGPRPATSACHSSMLPNGHGTAAQEDISAD